MGLSARALLLACSCALAGAPAAAAARAPEPLLDIAPTSTEFRDRVGDAPRAPRARTAQRGRAAAYAAPDGQRVSVAFSEGYREDPEVAQSYVDFLGGLEHGRELSSLRILLAPPREVEALCGGEDGTLACYSPRTRTMTVPGEQVETGGGVTTAYVVAHEYGHHVAAFRSNSPWSALEYGPKYWASQEAVCLGVLRGVLSPGDQGSSYLANPGESWADTYAHLAYPDVEWQYTELLRPDAASYAAARRDVLAPWTTPQRRTFNGVFGGGQTRSFVFDIGLDGAVVAVLDGPRRAQYDLQLISDGKVHTATRTRGSKDRLTVRSGCRDRPTERLTLRVVRRSGSGPFSVRLSYPG